MHRRRFRLALAVGVALLAAGVTGAAILLPSWIHSHVEGLVSEALGRDFAIAGPVDVSFSPRPRITATDLTLANAPWGSEPVMLHVRRATVVLDLASLWSGPVRVNELELDEARLLLEANDEGRGNWVFTPGSERERPAAAAGRPAVDFAHAAIRGLELVYRPRPEAAPVRRSLRELAASLDPVTRRIELRGGGLLEEAPWEITGRLGTLESLLAGRDIDYELDGRVGDSAIGIRGRLREPHALATSDLEASAEGPDIAAALGHFGIRSRLNGAFQLRGRFTPGRDGVDVDVELQGVVGGVTVTARGVVSSLTAPEQLDLQIESAGTDASELGSWLGVQGVPPRPFDLAGRVRRDDGHLFLEEATAQFGSTSLRVTGELGAPPRFVGTDLAVRAAGDDLAELSTLTRLHLPPGPFEVGGRFFRREGGLAFAAAELRFAGAEIRAHGNLGEPPGLPNLDLSFEAAGPNLAKFSAVATVDLPPGPFEVRGRVAREGPALALDTVIGRHGDDTLSVTGRLMLAKRAAGSDAQVRISGPDFAQSAARAALAALPALATLRGVPAEPFDVAGRLRLDSDGTILEEVEARVGRLAATLEGRISAPSASAGTALAGRIHGPSFADLEAWGLPGTLPADPFSIAGRLRFENGVALADSIGASLGADRAVVDGVLGTLPDLSGFDATVEASGSHLAALGRFFPASELAAPGRLPAVDYSISGRVRRLPSGFDVREVRARAGGMAVRLDGTVGFGKDLSATDLRFEADSADTDLLSQIAGSALPAGPFTARGRLAFGDSGLLCDDVAITIGDARATLSGTLGASPGFAGTDLRIDLAGSDLGATLGPASGRQAPPAEAFELSMDLSASAGRLAARRVSARLGESDFEGSLTMRFDGRPVVEADLRSRRLDLHRVFAGFGALPPSAGAEQNGSRKTRLISDEPLTIGALGKLDATLRLAAAELVLPGLVLRDAVLAAELSNGALRFDRFEGSGSHGGRATATLALEPQGDGYRLRTSARLEDGRLVVPGKELSPAVAPKVDIELDFAGEGRSLHEIAASGEGRLAVVVGSGRLPDLSTDSLTPGVLRSLLDALHPFREASDESHLDCGLAVATITGGELGFERVAARSDKMTAVGRGGIDLASEEIDLSWSFKRRKGLRKAKSSISDVHIQLGGTLGSPTFELKPLETVTSTGAAVATAGFTMLFGGIHDRLTGASESCVKALAKAR